MALASISLYEDKTINTENHSQVIKIIYFYKPPAHNFLLPFPGNLLAQQGLNHLARAETFKISFHLSFASTSRKRKNRGTDSRRGVHVS